MNRLYLIEGVPGSGKTTLAKRLAEKLRESGEDVHLFLEGDLHPADMAWCALLTKEEYARVKATNPALAPALDSAKTDWRERVIVAYTKLPPLNEELYEYFESREVYDGRADAKTFQDIHRDRWARFGREASGTYVFECGAREWETRVTEYVAQSPYGRQRSIVGAAGMAEYFAERQRSELNMLPELPAKTHVLTADFVNQESRENALIDALLRAGREHRS